MSEFTLAPAASTAASTAAPSGFSFDLIHRNALIESSSSTSSSNIPAKLPKALKTGTTIVGLVYKNGIVLGADTRSTNDTTVADKNCQKIHYIAPNIYCCGAGTAADTEKTTDAISSQMELLRLNTHSESRVVTACTLLKRMLFRYQGYISAALILGGCDVDGPHLYQIYPHGSTGKLPFTTMGSGSLAAIAVFEEGYKDDLEEGEAVELVKRAILAGVWNDLGSGSNVDTCVIRMDGSVEHGRNCVMPNEVGELRKKVRRSDVLNMRSGTTAVLGETFRKRMGGGVTLEDVVVTEMET